MKARAALSLFGLCALFLLVWSLFSAGRGSTRDLLTFDARVLVRLQGASFLDFYRYTDEMGRLGFEGSKHVLVRTELTADHLGWSSVLIDDRVPGRGCAVYGGVLEHPLPTPGGSLPYEPGVPVCDPTV